MRENRPSGSEGGGVEANRLSLPLSPNRASGGIRPQRRAVARLRAIPPYELQAHMIRTSETLY